MKSLVNRLKKTNILWRPAAFDITNANEWLLETVSPTRAFSTVVMTDDRWEGKSFENVARNYSVTNGHILSCRKVCEYERLKGLLSALSMRMEGDRVSADMGRSVEYEYQIASDDSERNEVRVRVIFVVAESVEFFLKYLLPNGIEVSAVCSKGYHIGFNACRSSGWWVRKAAIALKAEWLVSDCYEELEAGRPLCAADETLAVYPELKLLPDGEIGDRLPSELGDGTFIWDLPCDEN